MFAIKLAVVVLALFILGVIRDRRSFANAVMLGLGLALAALGAAVHLAQLGERRVLLALVLLIAAGPFFVAGYLLQNGITMTRKESLRPANLLSFVAGLAILAVIGLTVAASSAQIDELSLTTGITLMLFGYFSFLFVSFVLYAFIYDHLPIRRNTDFVIVLGSGLRGSEVPPLLASRLDRARAVYESVARRVKNPTLIVSGGKGSDEQVSEATAMADYLIARDFPADRIVREDQSRTTEENLVNSKELMPAGSSCIIVTSSFHVFRAAMIARRAGVNGQVTGARTARYYWPSATIREFAAVFLTYKVINGIICLLIIAAPLAYVYLYLHHPI
ncbi:MAG TPA: YdcF family protein [Streptosporangiaceae bacterium]|nr:YdcF family protein [Streptosporangiaceae bacterium]